MRLEFCLDFFEGSVGNDSEDPQTWSVKHLLCGEDIDDEDSLGVKTIHPIALAGIKIPEANGIDPDCGQNGPCTTAKKIRGGGNCYSLIWTWAALPGYGIWNAAKYKIHRFPYCLWPPAMRQVHR